MSESSSSTEQIINPAPAQTFVSSVQSSGNRSSSLRPSNAGNELCLTINDDTRIKELTSNLRLINNICEPVCDYVKFQRFMSPDVRILIDVNQWIMLMYAFKGAVKGYIDYEYMDITDPPSSLKQAMEKAYTGLDSVSEAFASSMKEVISLAQSRLLQQTQSSSSNQPSIVKSESSILSAMSESSSSKLP